ncbi:ogr/Delta-like zinc finger family protein [Thauera butanivorans]|uniref:ogr/Delta-like zinc finger family protein n=1 Tax=Thauera butanivorans TaxID=86174 RepID=UPI000838C4C1|nr:ogr/Delta-like zinc finger family protein [Thauera butanivorans]
MSTPVPANTTTRQLPLGVALTCPHCGSRAHIRTSKLVTEIYRDAWALCTCCGFKGRAHVAWDAEVNPSLMPNARVSLPRIEYREAIEQFFADTQDGKPQQDLFLSSG